ncbi:putative 2,3-bisphosphoglycerate-independent phosphoglycerate mutase [Halotydeus destructor]|nr:putative 2,3-bisphosphoglycerate-independent phosphoglycerate mutase [Halotydeus destructor]
MIRAAIATSNLAVKLVNSQSFRSASVHICAQTNMSKKVCLIVIDGWGISKETNGNAIFHAKTPVMDSLTDISGKYTTLDASGLSVGLPDGLMGNSEVGHLNIGAGRPIYQDIVRINLDISKDKLIENQYVKEACESAKSKSGGRLHFLGLVSDGGVHAHIDHLFALLECAKRLGVPETFIQFFSDGRDTAPDSGKGFVEKTIQKTKDLQYGKLATITGRYYAMDRDQRWERIKIAFEGLVQGKGEEATEDNVLELIEKRYTQEKKITDEFMTPIILNKDGLIKDNDTLVFIDYRADRMREITETFGLKLNFETEVAPKNLNIFTMTQYQKDYPFKNLYPKTIPKNVLAEVVGNAGLKQFHCGETEKWAHVTFFFNGGQDKAFDGEDRKLCPSPKVATYDLQPEMNAAGVAKEMSEAVSSGTYDFLMCNFANPDMVGHSGQYEPTVIACAATDKGIGQIMEACNKAGYVMLVTADHGNAEQMYDPNGKPFTAHTSNRVPFIMTGDKNFGEISHNAALCDVAPTVLDLMGLALPAEMEGKSLLAK